MNVFPPPQLPPSGPPAEPGRSRLMIGGVAALAAVVVAGGLVVGSQFVSADRASIETTSAAAPGDDAPVDEAETGDDEPDPADTDDDDKADWTEFDRCLSEQLGIDLSTEEEDGELDIAGDQVEAAEQACSDLLPADLKVDFEAFEAFEQCLDEQLGGAIGDLLGEGDELGAEVWNGSVVVENLGGDGEEALTVLDFGAGDATVVVTKSGDTVSVETTGDVTTLDTTFFEAEKAEWKAAEQACADLLPEGLNVFDMELGDMELGDMDFGELGGMIEEFPFEEMFDEGMLGEFEMMLDEDMLSEIKDMFESGEFGDFEDLFDDRVDASSSSDPTD